MNMLLVILLLIAVIVLSNAPGLLRVLKPNKGNSNWFPKTTGAFRSPFQHKEKSLDELHRRVQELGDTKPTDAP